MTEIEKLQEQVNSLQKQIDLMKLKESEEVKPLRFKDLTHKQKYHSVETNEVSSFRDFYHVPEHLQNVIMGNAFKTHDESIEYAPKYLRKLEILEWLHRNRDFENGTFFLMYHKKNDQITYYQDCNNLISQYPLTNPHEAIETFGNDLKLIFDL